MLIEALLSMRGPVYSRWWVCVRFFFLNSSCLSLSLSPPAEQALHPEPPLLHRPSDWQGGHPWPGEAHLRHKVTAHCLTTNPHALVSFFPFFFFFFCTVDLLALAVPIKSDTQLRYKLSVPVVLSLCSLVYSSAHRKRTASWLCTFALVLSVRVGNVHLLILVHV